MRSDARYAAHHGEEGVRPFVVTSGDAVVVDLRDERHLSRAAVRELSHDLRHPCATIRALAAAIEMEADLPPAAATRLRQIVAEARRVEDLCTQVLASPGHQAGLVDLDRVVGDIVAVNPRVTADTVPVKAQIDELDLRRILWNLIDNALRAAGPAGAVVVSAWATDHEAVVAVADDGPGFGAAPSGAAGLGLGIVHSLAARAGGQVHIGAGRRGGVEVRVELPLPAAGAGTATHDFDRAVASGERS